MQRACRETFHKTVGKEFAEDSDFKDWEKYTPHDNCHQCCTILASDLAVPEKMRMNHLRHKSNKSAEPYIHQNSVIQRAVQGVLHGGLHRDKKGPAAVLESKKEQDLLLGATAAKKKNI